MLSELNWTVLHKMNEIMVFSNGGSGSLCRGCIVCEVEKDEENSVSEN